MHNIVKYLKIFVYQNLTELIKLVNFSERKNIFLNIFLKDFFFFSSTKSFNNIYYDWTSTLFSMSSFHLFSCSLIHQLAYIFIRDIFFVYDHLSCYENIT